MAGTFTPQQPAPLQQALHNKAVADTDTPKPNAKTLQSQLDTKIGHMCTHNTAMERPGLLALGSDYVDQLITIHFGAVAVDHKNPVTITVKRNTQVRLPVSYRLFKRLKVSGAHAQ